MNSLEVHNTRSVGSANSMRSALSRPTTTFSSQNNNTIGNTGQPSTSTPYSGSRLAVTSTSEEGEYQVTTFALSGSETDSAFAGKRRATALSICSAWASDEPISARIFSRIASAPSPGYFLIISRATRRARNGVIR